MSLLRVAYTDTAVSVPRLIALVITEFRMVNTLDAAW
jgi:hypothetical protein